jgi:hypothetical protein
VERGEYEGAMRLDFSDAVFQKYLNGSAMPDAGIRSGRDIMEMQFGVS